MLAMDIPIAMMSGLVLAEAGKNMLTSGDKEKVTFIRLVVLVYAAIFIAPTPVYYFLGWPAWEVNYIWRWVEHIQDKPLRAAFSYVLLACAVIPTWLGFELGRFFLLKGKPLWVRIAYIAMLIITGIIILAMWDITFNIYNSFENFDKKISYSFWTHPFATGWAISAVYFWGSLAWFYIWLMKKK